MSKEFKKGDELVVVSYNGVVPIGTRVKVIGGSGGGVIRVRWRPKASGNYRDDCFYDWYFAYLDPTRCRCEECERLFLEESVSWTSVKLFVSFMFPPVALALLLVAEVEAIRDAAAEIWAIR